MNSVHARVGKYDLEVIEGVVVSHAHARNSVTSVTGGGGVMVGGIGVGSGVRSHTTTYDQTEMWIATADGTEKRVQVIAALALRESHRVRCSVAYRGQRSYLFRLENRTTRETSAPERIGWAKYEQLVWIVLYGAAFVPLMVAGTILFHSVIPNSSALFWGVGFAVVVGLLWRRRRVKGAERLTARAIAALDAQTLRAVS